MKKIVLAFDSFKGSVGSFEIAKAAEKAIQEELPDCQIIRFPIADGGEGTTEALCSALHAQTVSCRVHDPFMKPIEVSYRKQWCDGYYRNGLGLRSAINRFKSEKPHEDYDLWSWRNGC